MSPHAVSIRMTALADLSDTEIELLQAMPQLPRRRAGQNLLSRAGHEQPPQMLIAAWASYQRLLSDGRRQIIDFILPGEGVGSLTHDPQSSSLAIALTSVVTVDASGLVRAVADRPNLVPGLAHAMRLMSRADSARLHDQVVRLGRQTAYERLLHLLLDLHHRLDAVGLVVDNSFALPVTQEMLADTLGLSAVHMNRTLQQARKDGLFEMAAGSVTLRKIELMQSLADWTPAVSSFKGVKVKHLAV